MGFLGGACILRATASGPKRWYNAGAVINCQVVNRLRNRLYGAVVLAGTSYLPERRTCRNAVPPVRLAPTVRPLRRYDRSDGTTAPTVRLSTVPRELFC
jgi:hypothetical protein